MDMFSGSVPRKFIPLQIDIPPPEDAAPTVPSIPPITEILQPTSNVIPPQSAAASNLAPHSGSSGSAESDVNAFAQAVVARLEQTQASQQVFESSTEGIKTVPCRRESSSVTKDTEDTANLTPRKRRRQEEGNSEAELQNSEVESNVTGNFDNCSEQNSFPQVNIVKDTGGMTTDLSEGEQSHTPSLYGVSGRPGFPPGASTSKFPGFSGSFQLDEGHSDEEAAVYREHGMGVPKAVF